MSICKCCGRKEATHGELCGECRILVEKAEILYACDAKIRTLARKLYDEIQGASVDEDVRRLEHIASEISVPLSAGDKLFVLHLAEKFIRAALHAINVSR
jgi:hypothetical protein